MSPRDPPVSSFPVLGWLVVNASLEAGRASVYKLDTAVGFSGDNGNIDTFENHITTVPQVTSCGSLLFHFAAWLGGSKQAW